MAKSKNLRSINQNVPSVVTYAILIVLFVLAVILVQRVRTMGMFLGGY